MQFAIKSIALYTTSNNTSQLCTIVHNMWITFTLFELVKAIQQFIGKHNKTALQCHKKSLLYIVSVYNRDQKALERLCIVRGGSIIPRNYKNTKTINNYR